MNNLFRYFIIVLSFAFLAFTPRGDRYFEISKNLEVFASVFKEINNIYLEDIPPNHLLRTAIDTMLKSLDPYTNYLSEDEVENYRTQNTGQYASIGATIKEFGNKFFVTIVYEGLPAYKNGLKIGDEIIKVDDIIITNKSKDDVINLLHGQVNTTIELTIKRYGVDNPIRISFGRQKIKVNHVPYSGMFSSQGYIQLTSFMKNASKEVSNALTTLLSQGAKGIILDLRSNPGGLVEEAVNICNLFIPKHSLVVTTKGKLSESTKSFFTTSNPVNTEIPVIVLINQKSASASEIVAGTLQDYDRAVVVGEKSFGKGLVQLSVPLKYNSQVKITTAKYYIPSGRCIQVLDYSHRREDGYVDAVPDSLRQSFTTMNGRTVFDGGGIDPDILISPPPLSEVTKILILNGCLFEYANKYSFIHSTIDSARYFRISDSEFDDFFEFIRSKELHFNTKSDSLLKELISLSIKEIDNAEIKYLLDSLSAELLKKNELDITSNEDQIKSLLEKEIVSRFYYQKGVVEIGIKDDSIVQKSIKLLETNSEYKQIIKP